MPNEVKYPEITVQLSGQDGNAFAVMASVQRKMRRAGIDNEEIEMYVQEATSGDYDHLLQTTMKWVNVE